MNKNWKEKNIVDIFVINKGFYNKKPCEDNEGTIPFLGATKFNNGITQWNDVSTIDSYSKTGSPPNTSLEKKLYKKNSIAVTNNGSIGYAYYMPYMYTSSHDVNPLYIKEGSIDVYSGLFLATCIHKQSICFRYVRKWRPKRMKKSKILVPIDEKGSLDIKTCQDTIKPLYKNKQAKYIHILNKRIEELGAFKSIPNLNDAEWKEFFLEDVFTLFQRGKRLKKADHVMGNIPYASSTGVNNGIDQFIGNKNKIRKFNNCISLNNSGSVGKAFYEPFTFIASDHVTIFKNKKFNKYHYMFLAVMMSNLEDKYNFNREIKNSRIQREKILLPIDKYSEIDFDYMEQYIKNLLLKKYNQYLKYVNKSDSK